MNTAQLLAELEPLTHHARVKRMLEVGRLPATEREPLLDALTQGAVYERQLVAFACHGSRDASRAYQVALDPSGTDSQPRQFPGGHAVFRQSPPGPAA